MSLSVRRNLQSIVVILAVSLLVLSIYFVYDGVTAFQQGSTDYIYQLTTGVFGIMASAYMLSQFTRRLRLSQRAAPPNIVTVIECRKCGLKQIRKFVNGDYVFKSVENCQKCVDPMLITGIYAEEVKKK